MNSKTKQLLFVILIIIVALIGYNMFFVNDESGDEALVSDRVSEEEFVDGQQILTLLDQLNEVKLDESIFSDKSFTSLINFERPIQSQILGRPNPFLPLGR